MSHFVVAVATKTNDPAELEAALQPWHEWECTGIDDEHVRHVPVDTESFDKEFNEYGKREDTPDNRLEFAKEWYSIDLVVGSDDPAPKGNAYIRLHTDLMKDPHTKMDVYRYTNPRARWDWWVIGGRWSDRLLTAEGNCNQAQKDDILVERMKDILRGQRRADLDSVALKLNADSWSELAPRWEAFIDAWPGSVEAAKKADLNIWDWADKQHPGHPINRGRKLNSALCGWGGIGLPDEERDPEHWVQNVPALQTRVLLRDGEWEEIGEMGWWGISTDTMTRREWDARIDEWFKSLPGDEWITMVDCHI